MRSGQNPVTKKARRREATRRCVTAPRQEKNATSSYPREAGGTTRTRQGDTYRREPGGNSAVPLRRTGRLFPVSRSTDEGGVLSRHLDTQTNPSQLLLTPSHQSTKRKTSFSEKAWKWSGLSKLFFPFFAGNFPRPRSKFKQHPTANTTGFAKGRERRRRARYVPVRAPFHPYTDIKNGVCG